MAEIKKYIARYLKWRGEHEKEELTEREERVNWYKSKMGSPAKLNKLQEKDILELLENLWALRFWKNKRYRAEKLINDNGLEKLRSAFVDLLYSNLPVSNRWDKFRKSIKGFGPSSLSEILTLVFPDKYGIMNMKPLTVLPHFGLLPEKEARSISTGYTSGKNYERFMKALDSVRDDLQKNGLPDADYIDADFFIWYLFEHVFELKGKRDKRAAIRSALGIKEELEAKVAEVTKVVPPEKATITNHSEAESTLLKLGLILGYDTYSPDKSKEAHGQKLEEFITLEEIPQFTTQTLLDTIKNIDVIWFQDEFPVFCFEIEHTTGVTQGLLRLYQTSQLSTKLFVVAPAEVLRKFDKELNKMPFRKIKHRYIFRSYEDLTRFFKLAESYTELKKKFFKED